MAQMDKDKAAFGTYASQSGLLGRKARDTAIERWLHESVVPVFDRVARGEEKLIEASEVFSGLESRYRARKLDKTTV
jgi:hypothetical protein